MSHGAHPPEVKVEALAADMLEVLLTDRNFQKYLIDLVVEHLLSERNVTDVTELVETPRKPPLSSRSETIAAATRSLTSLVESVTETFLRSVDLALFNIVADSNRDAATLFSVRIQIDRFLNSDHINLNRFEQAVRRISALLRTFALRISTPFHIANNAFFASSLCDILYRFEEYCSIYEKKLADEFEKLRNAIEDFYFAVVKQLNKMVLRQQEEILKRKRKEEMEKILTKTPRRTRSASNFGEPRLQQSKSAGFLLPRDLNEKRKAIARSVPRNRSATLASRSRRTTGVAARIGGKWEKLLNSEPILRKSLSSDEQGLAALRLAREITKDFVDELANRVEKVCATKCLAFDFSI